MKKAAGLSAKKIHSYAQGGMVGPQGVPVEVGQAPPAVGVAPPTERGMPAEQAQQPAMDPKMFTMQVNQFASQHPDKVAQLADAIQIEMDSGDLTPQELNQLVQLATVVVQNPDMYPYVRQQAVQQGIAAEEDLPAEYDQGLMFSILLAGQAIQSGGGQQMPQGGGQQIPQEAGPAASGEVPINAHEGEYVVPREVVAMKGKEFFDNLVGKYRQDT